MVNQSELQWNMEKTNQFVLLVRVMLLIVRQLGKRMDKQSIDCKTLSGIERNAEIS